MIFSIYTRINWVFFSIYTRINWFFSIYTRINLFFFQFIHYLYTIYTLFIHNLYIVFLKLYSDKCNEQLMHLFCIFARYLFCYDGGLLSCPSRNETMLKLSWWTQSTINTQSFDFSLLPGWRLIEWNHITNIAKWQFSAWFHYPLGFFWRFRRCPGDPFFWSKKGFPGHLSNWSQSGKLPLQSFVVAWWSQRSS